MTKIGFHVSSQAAIHSGWLTKIPSTIHLVLAVGAGGEIPRTLEVASQAPKAHIIYRAWTYGSVGHSDHFPEYYAKYGADPNPLIKIHEPVFSALESIRHRVSYQLFNETGMDMWPQFVEFNTNFVKAMDARGLSASVIGCGPGYPTGSREDIKRTWQAGRPLWEAINNSAVQHYINLHEYVGYPYTQYVPYLAGRYKWLIEDLSEMGLLTNKIKIYAGEYGWADPAVLDSSHPPGLANGYRGFMLQGVTPDQLAQDLVSVSETVYADSHFIGLCVYCLGDSGNWIDFDLLREPGILEGIQKRIKEVNHVIVETPDTIFRVVDGPLRIRLEPGGIIIGTKNIGDTIVSNGYVDYETYRWRRLVESGFCAEYNQTTPTNVFLEPVVIEPDWKLDILQKIQSVDESLMRLEAQVNTIQADLLALRALVDDA